MNQEETFSVNNILFKTLVGENVLPSPPICFNKTQIIVFISEPIEYKVQTCMPNRLFSSQQFRIVSCV